MRRDLHKEVRVIYRACRRLYGKEKTQDECLRIFKIVFPELYRLRESTNERESLDENMRLQIQAVVKSWHPKKKLKALTERIDSLIGLPLDYEREELITLLEDILPVVMRIRKLTPRECGRLMDCDDSDIDRIEASGLSNSAMYKLYGNSICVGVLTNIFRKLFIETEPDIVKGVPQQLTLF